MEILYNGSDIVEYINETSIEIDLSLGDRTDTIYLCFEREDGSIDKWGYAPGDTLQIKEEKLDTGTMVVTNVRFLNSQIHITASTVPDVIERKKTEWSSISFKTLCKELAQKINYGIEFYGMDSDPVYTKVVQEDKDDLGFLAERCDYEGCVLTAFNNTFRVISEEYVDSQTATTYRLEADDTTSRTTTTPQYGSCTVTDSTGNKKGTYKIDKKNAKMGVFLDFELSSIDEGRRFAKNILLRKNRFSKTGIAWTNELYLELVPGNIVTVDCGEFTDKEAVITRMRFDLMNETTKFWFRILGE